MRLLLSLAFRSAVATIALLVCATAAHAQDAETARPGAFELAPGESSLWTQLGVYGHSDGQDDGNPFLDEELTVIEPLVVWDSQVTDDWGYGITLSYDFVSSASIDRLSNFPGQSGASGDNYVGLDWSSRHRLSNEQSLTWHTGFSFEYDYLSLNGGASLTTKDPAVGSSTTYGLDLYYDVVDIIRFDGTQNEGSEDRISVTGSWSHSRPLSRLWNGEVTTLFTLQSGFLETAYNAVVLETPGGLPNPNLFNGASGIEITEELPDTRLRAAIRPRARRWLSDRSAFEMGGRLYGDDWGVFAVAVEPRYIYEVVDDRLAMRLRYRYYVQTAADDFDESFLASDPTPEFRTQDSELGDLDSHTVGVRFDAFNTRGAPTWYVDFNYALRSDGLDHFYVGLGYRFGF
jgi:hypothetical protein